jgi:arylsulfatase A-like enzyme
MRVIEFGCGARLTAVAAVIILALAGYSRVQAAEKPDVVFIAIEDFSPQRLGCYGGPVRSPNIDRLASEGVLFEKAYCMSPVCNASRTALLTGLRPNTTGVYSNSQDWRKMLPDVVTMPMHFRRHGYQTIRIGKMYHGTWEHDPSWTQVLPELFDRTKAGAKRPARRPAKPVRNRSKDNLKWGPTGNQPEHDRDGQIAHQVAQFLQEQHDTPFLLAVGLHSPHLAFRAPDRFHEMYPVDQIELPRTPADDLTDTPLGGPHADQKRLTEAEWRDVVSSHYATISYVDWSVGNVLDAIRSTGREKNTIVVLWSDHGFMLGEHFLWRKVNLYEESARVAFVWKVPGLAPAGARCPRPVETIDTFPTLFDLCGIPQPKGVEGISMKPLLEDPARPWKKGAITWRAGGGNQVAIQTEHFRLNKRVDTGFLELYDHRVDPREFTNVAEDPAYAADVDRLSALLEGDWQACLPEEN